MDLARAIAALLIAVGAVGAGGALPLQDAKWIVAEARLEALTSLPPSCISDRLSPVQLGIAEAAFQTPLLLGGQAARAGLSCASCHPSGRANQGFRFPGLSGAPGTADVTSSMMSHHRGDAIFNPVRIPDLAMDIPKISRDPESPALTSFIRGLIVEEFDGPEPAPAVLDAIVNYVRAMRPEACQSAKRVPITLRRHFTEIDNALEMARLASFGRDKDSARLMLAAARHRLGLVHERYAGRQLNKQRALIIAVDRQMQALQSKVATAKLIDVATIREVIGGLRVALETSEAKSLYNAKRLARAVGQ